MSQIPKPYVRRTQPTQGGTFHRQPDGSLTAVGGSALPAATAPAKPAKAAKNPARRRKPNH